MLRRRKKTIGRLVLVAAILIAVILFRVFDLGDYLTLSSLKESRQRFSGLYADHPVAVSGFYMLVYIFITGLSLPGATVLTLAGGALFGLWRGTLIVSFASTIGATIAC